MALIEELNLEQNARVAALKASREVLSEKSTSFASTSSKSVDTMDLLSIAGWVIDGEDPWKPNHIIDAEPVLSQVVTFKDDGES